MLLTGFSIDFLLVVSKNFVTLKICISLRLCAGCINLSYEYNLGNQKSWKNYWKHLLVIKIETTEHIRGKNKRGELYPFVYKTCYTRTVYENIRGKHKGKKTKDENYIH